MSNAASFVKRSKPRSSASRISSTYDDINDGPGPSSSNPQTASTSSSIVNTEAQNGTTMSTARQSLSALELDAESESSSSSVVFRARTRGAKRTSTSASASTTKVDTGTSQTYLKKERSAITTMEDQGDEGDGGEAFEIRRSRLSVAGKEARRSAAGLSSLTSSSLATPKRSTPLRPTSFQQEPPDVAMEPSSSSTPNIYTSKYLDELRSSTPTARSRGHSPAPAPTGPGIRIDNPIMTQTSAVALDGTNDDQLARTKFPADFAYDAIPSESVIRAAKEKRAKLRAAATCTSTSSDDYISLTPLAKSSALKASVSREVDDGPHPHSRLQREEDEFGDGEEEFADYTGATERIPIGEKAQKEWKERQRKEMEAAVRGDFDEDANLPDDARIEEMDEDEEEWERAQLRRTQVFPTSSADSQSREPSPYRPAPIPTATPIPSVGTCSTRLALTLRALEQSTAASGTIISSTSKELEGLDAAERENKLDVAAVEVKASWFNELDAFVGSLARFMEEKIQQVEALEKEAVDLLVKRNRMIGNKRARWFESRLKQCLATMPTLSIIPDFGEPHDDQQTDTANTSIDEELSDMAQIEILSPADELSFALAQREIVSKLTASFSDVQAAEYLDPAASISGIRRLPFLFHAEPDSVDLHPRSVVVRFEEWRRRYPDEYAQVWGGLSVAQIWEFYARLEMISWDVFHTSRTTIQEGWKVGASAIGQFRWFAGASDYADRAASSGELMGGDDEVLSSLVSNVLIDKLITLANKGAFDPWSSSHAIEIVEAVDLVQTVLGSHARCISLIEAYLNIFQVQLDRFQQVLTLGSVGIIGEGKGEGEGEGEKVVEEMLEVMIGQLLSNLVRWSRLVKLNTTTQNPTPNPTLTVSQLLVHLVETLIIEVLEPLISLVDRTESARLRRTMIEMVPKVLVVRSTKLSDLFHRAF